MKLYKIYTLDQINAAQKQIIKEISLSGHDYSNGSCEDKAYIISATIEGNTHLFLTGWDKFIFDKCPLDAPSINELTCAGVSTGSTMYSGDSREGLRYEDGKIIHYWEKCYHDNIAAEEEVIEVLNVSKLLSQPAILEDKIKINQ